MKLWFGLFVLALLIGGAFIYIQYFNENISIEEILKNLIDGNEENVLEPEYVNITLQGTDDVIADIFIAEHHPTTGYGSYPQMQVNGYDSYKEWSLIKFNLTSFDRDTNISHAELYLYSSFNSFDPADNVVIDTYEFDNGWDDSPAYGMTWNYFQLMHLNDIGDLLNSTDDLNGDTGWLKMNVTSWVINRSSLYGEDRHVSFFLNTSSNHDYAETIYLDSKEEAIPSQRPKLIITYDNQTYEDEGNQSEVNITSSGMDVAIWDANILQTDQAYNGGNTTFGYINGPNISAEYRGYVMFDISDFTTDTTVIDANMTGWLNGKENATTYAYHVYDWSANNANETTLNWTNQACGTIFDNDTNCNLTSVTFVNNEEIGWAFWNMTEMLQTAIDLGKDNITIALWTNTSNSERLTFREHTSGAYRPYLSYAISENTTVTVDECNAPMGENVSIFSTASPWRQRIPNWDTNPPVDVNSTEMLNSIEAFIEAGGAVYNYTTVGSYDWTTGIFYGNFSNATKYNITCQHWDEPSFQECPGWYSFSKVVSNWSDDPHIARNIPVLHNVYEDPTSDPKLCQIDPVLNQGYCFSEMEWNSTYNTWYATGIEYNDMGGLGFRAGTSYPGPGGAGSTGYWGTPRRWEIETGEINHPLQCGFFGAISGYHVLPATENDGSVDWGEDVGYGFPIYPPYEGQILQMNPDTVDCTTVTYQDQPLTAQAQVLCRAWQEYGCVIMDESAGAGTAFESLTNLGNMSNATFSREEWTRILGYDGNYSITHIFSNIKINSSNFQFINRTLHGPVIQDSGYSYGYNDADGDGWTTSAVGNWLADCDDNDVTVNPAMVEKFNGKDDNCDGEIDECVAEIAVQTKPQDGYTILETPHTIEFQKTLNYPSAITNATLYIWNSTGIWNETTWTPATTSFTFNSNVSLVDEDYTWDIWVCQDSTCGLDLAYSRSLYIDSTRLIRFGGMEDDGTTLITNVNISLDHQNTSSTTNPYSLLLSNFVNETGDSYTENVTITDTDLVYVAQSFSEVIDVNTVSVNNSLSANQITLNFIQDGSPFTTNGEICDTDKCRAFNDTSSLIVLSSVTSGRVQVVFNNQSLEANGTVIWGQYYEYNHQGSTPVTEDLEVINDVSQTLYFNIKDNGGNRIENAFVRLHYNEPPTDVWANHTLVGQRITNDEGETDLKVEDTRPVKVTIFKDGYDPKEMFLRTEGADQYKEVILSESQTSMTQGVWVYFPSSFQNRSSDIRGTVLAPYVTSVEVQSDYNIILGIPRRTVTEDWNGRYPITFTPGVDFQSTGTDNAYAYLWIDNESWGTYEIVYDPDRVDIFTLPSVTGDSFLNIILGIGLIMIAGFFGYMFSSVTAGFSAFMIGSVLIALVSPMFWWLTFVSAFYMVLKFTTRSIRE